MAGALERIEHAVSAVRGELRVGAPPRWLLLSRFGTDFLADAASPEHDVRPSEVALLGGGLLRVERLRLGRVPLLALEVEDDAADAERAALNDALPVLIAGQLRLRGVILLLAACGLASVARAPALAVVHDWIRAGNEDPLRGLDAARLGARFPELRGLSREREATLAAELLARHGALPPCVAVARRGPSGASDAEMEAWGRLGGDLLVEGGAAEVVAARQQGLPFVAFALVLDRAAAHTIADPGELAQSAELLLPRLSRLLPELLLRLEQDDGGRAETGR